MYYTIYHIALIALITTHVTGNTFIDNFTTDKVTTLLASRETRRYLASYPNVNQRYIIKQQLTYCPFTNTCGFTFQMKTDGVRESCCKPCSCDVSKCRLSNTCCPDVEYIPSGMPLDVEPAKKECHLMHLVKKPGFGREAIYMFATCPGSANKTMQHLCVRSYGDDDVSHFSDIVPVTRKDDSSVYRNKYCAFCNNLAESEINYWYTRISCKHGQAIAIKEEKAVIKELYAHGYCNLAFEPQHKADMENCTKATSTCNETGLWKTYDPLLEEACSFYITEHHQTNVYEDVYSNIFCMMCNGRKPIKYQCNFGFGHLSYHPFSFTGLLDFSFFKDSSEQPKPEPEDCGNGSMFDPYRRSCRDLHCSPLRKLKNGECFKLYSKVTDIVYVVYIRVVPIDVISASTAHDLAINVLFDVDSHIFDALWTKQEKPNICGKQIIYKINMDFTNNTVLGNIKASSLLYYDIKIEFPKDMLYDPDLVKKQIITAIEGKPLTVKPFLDETFSFTMSLRDDTGEWFSYYSNVSYQKYRNDSAKFWPPLSLSEMAVEGVPDADGKMILPYFEINDRYTGGCDAGNDRLKVATIKPCTMFQVWYRQFDCEETIYGIYFTKRQYLLKNSDFYYTNDSKNRIGVCSDTYFKFAEQIQIDHSLDAEMVLSIICVSLSVLALLVTLITFSLFPQLRTLPGLNNISLVVSLLVAQTMYLIGSFGPIPIGSVACKVVGAVVHFCWLHSVCWMNVCTYHMFHVFFKVRQFVNESSTKRLFRYHLYSIAVPTFMVVLNIAVALIASDHYDMGYGTVHCYISSNQMIGFTFGIPVATLLVANIAMFIAVAVKIKRTEEIQSNVKHNRDNLAIIIKLSTLTGVTWIFGFVYSFTKVPAVSYIFIVLNASQGFFLLVSFVFNRRILDLYRGKLFGVAPSTSADSRTRHQLYTVSSRMAEIAQSGERPTCNQEVSDSIPASC